MGAGNELDKLDSVGTEGRESAEGVGLGFRDTIQFNLFHLKSINHELHRFKKS